VVKKKTKQDGKVVKVGSIYLVFNYYHIIVVLGNIVTFTKVLTIYLSQFAPSILPLYLPLPAS
jgi:hypothetical protein